MLGMVCEAVSDGMLYAGDGVDEAVSDGLLYAGE